MDINKNHIGTANYFWKQVAGEIKAQYSHGGLTEFDFKAITVFPLLHISISQIDVTENTANLSYTILVADQNVRYSNDFQGVEPQTTFQQIGYTEDENYAFVLQEIYIRLIKAITKIEKAMFNSVNINRPFTLIPFIKDTDSILTGFTFQISMNIFNPIVTDGWC
jgi:hypothetical protein